MCIFPNLYSIQIVDNATIPLRNDNAHFAQDLLKTYFHFHEFDKSWEEHVLEDGVKYWQKTDEQGSELISFIRPLIRVDDDSASTHAATQSIVNCDGDAFLRTSASIQFGGNVDRGATVPSCLSVSHSGGNESDAACFE
jgi:hypothetical protein